MSAWGHHTFGRLALLFSILTTTVVSLVLVVLNQKDWSSAGWLLSTVKNQRATVQTFVQLISGLLAALQIYTVGQLLQFRLNLRIGIQAITLNTIKLFSALTVGKIDHELPLALALWTLVFGALIHLPGAFWAGAITPIVDSATIAAVYLGPDYSNTSAPWNDRSAINPGKYFEDMPSALQQVIAGASSDDSTPPRRAKLDNSGYYYVGRSYGVGSAVGLVQPDISSQMYTLNPVSGVNILNYTYNELGYQSRASCWNSSSSNITINRTSTKSTRLGGWDIWTYSVNGSLPNGAIDQFPGWYSSAESIFVTAGVIGADNSSYMYGFVGKHTDGSSWYLDNITCTVTFQPTIFQVQVNTVGENITVTPLASSDTELAPTPNLICTAFMQLPWMSIIASNLYATSVGDEMLTNIHTITNSRGDAATNVTDVMTGIEQAVEAVIDTGFGAIGAAQLFMSMESQKMPATAVIEVVRLGEAKFIFISFGLNLLLFLLVLFEAVRTLAWSTLPSLNILDIKSAILAVVAKDSVEAADGEVLIPEGESSLIIDADSGHRKYVRLAGG